MAVVDDVTSGLAAAIDALGALDPTTMADAESVVALHRQLARLEALTTRMVAASTPDAAGTTMAPAAPPPGWRPTARCPRR